MTWELALLGAILFVLLRCEARLSEIAGHVEDLQGLARELYPYRKPSDHE